MPPPRPASARSARSRSGQSGPRAGSAQGRPAPAPPRGEAELRGLLEPVVVAAGFELDALDVRTAGRRHTIRLVVDSDDGVGLDAVARLSRAASDELDRHEHLVGGSYTLEVTSPGVDRPLTAPRHWRRAHLRLVTVRPHEGAAFEGRVGAVGDDAVTLLVDGVLREVRYADVARATVEVEFAPPKAADLVLLGVDPAGTAPDDAAFPDEDLDDDLEDDDDLDDDLDDDAHDALDDAAEDPR
jgi:ribosome maturation factor RimP